MTRPENNSAWRVRGLGGFVWLVLCILPGDLRAEGRLPFAGMVTAERVHVRAGGNRNFEVLTTLDRDRTVVVVGQQYGWYRIELPPETHLYVARKLVDVEGRSGTIRADRVNVRAGPGTRFTVVGQLNQGQRVTVIAQPGLPAIRQAGDWYEIEAPAGLSGWISERFVAYRSTVEEFRRTQGQAESVRLAEPPLLAPAEAVQEEPPAIAALPRPFAQGVLRRGRAFFWGPTWHTLTHQGETLYYHRSDEVNLDEFLGRTVAIWGESLPQRIKDRPLIVVHEIRALGE